MSSSILKRLYYMGMMKYLPNNFVLPYIVMNKEREKHKGGEAEALIARGRSQNYMRMKKGRSKSRSRLNKD